MATTKKTPAQLKIAADKKRRLGEYKQEIVSEKIQIKNELKKANKLKKPVNH